MNNIVIASVKPKAGKTTVALGIAKKMGGKIGYMKPLTRHFSGRLSALRTRWMNSRSVSIIRKCCIHFPV